MRIKTIERTLSLNEIYDIIIELVKLEFEFDENSYANDSNLLILGINPKNKSIIIRSSIDKLNNRTFISTLAFNTKELIEFLKIKDMEKDITKTIGNLLFNLIKKRSEKAFNSTFMNFEINGLHNKKFQKAIMGAEKRILNRILNKLHKQYNFQEILMKFPFSLLDLEIDGTWGLWQEVYGEYLTLIENKLKELKKNSFKIYRNYNFASDQAYFQRISELVVIEEKEYIINQPLKIKKIKKNEANTQKDKLEDAEIEKKQIIKQNLHITFIFTHKKCNPMRLIKILKLSEEVKRFVKNYEKKLKSKYYQIKPHLILISLFGFEQNIIKYLRDNISGETKFAIPIFILPPVKNENIWHNLMVDNKFDSSDKYLKKNGYILRNNMNFDRFSNSQAGKFFNKAQYKKKGEKEEQAKKNMNNLKEWSHILNLDILDGLLDIGASRKQVEKSLEVKLR